MLVKQLKKRKTTTNTLNIDSNNVNLDKKQFL